ncbi:hypothetical protein [Helicobacter burdigaliensis]|uniref:hypothetical protein n=1 Tax=Helicobacter burdigaliensis TaxID=2315334 RepID=UPI000EF6CEBF|nr:hypothetical protein [Helicobacter burdigaliensis]
MHTIHLIIQSHFFLSLPLLLPPLINLIALFVYTSHTKRLHVLAFVAPAYYSLLAGSIFSGLVTWAMLGFSFSIFVLLMLLFWGFAFFLEILRHIKQKRILRQGADLKTREKFFSFARGKYLLDFCLFGILFLWRLF